MRNKTKKPVIATFSQRFLSPSMTFIYRQLKGVEDDFKVIGLTSNTKANLDIFPFAPVYEKTKTTLERLLRLYKKILGRYAVLSNSQAEYFKKIILANGVKLIHAHFGPSGIEILPVARDLRLPLLVSFHGYDASMLLKDRRYLSDLKGVLDYADIIAVSQYMKNKLIEIGADPRKISVIYYGISVQDNQVKRESIKKKVEEKLEIKFLQISNFDEKKGHKYTLLAFRKFLECYDKALLLLGGDGTLKNKIEDLSKELKINDKVKFLGRMTPIDVKSYMNNSDVFLHHSVTSSSGNEEGIPNVIMEAMAAGLPVISTYHSGIPELIKDGENGFLVNEKDIDTYAKKMTEILSIESYVGQNAIQTVFEDFNIIMQSQKLKELYKKLIN